MVFWWCALIRNPLITLEANSFSKIPTVNIHSWTLLSKQHHHRGMGIKLAMHILCFTTYGGHFVSHDLQTCTK